MYGRLFARHAISLTLPPILAVEYRRGNGESGRRAKRTELCPRPRRFRFRTRSNAKTSLMSITPWLFTLYDSQWK